MWVSTEVMWAGERVSFLKSEKLSVWQLSSLTVNKVSSQWISFLFLGGTSSSACTHRSADLVADSKVEATLLVHRVVDAGELRQLWPVVFEGVVQETVVGAVEWRQQHVGILNNRMLIFILYSFTYISPTSFLFLHSSSVFVYRLHQYSL